VRCTAITKGGSRCSHTATADTFCHLHHPDRAEQRRRDASRGGKAGGNGRSSGLSETAEAKRWIKGLVARLLKGEVERGVAATAFMGLGTLARYIELERRLIEQEELVARMEALEAGLDERPQGRNGGGYARF
jgi:hypothetical protein